APDSAVRWRSVEESPEEIAEWNLPTRLTKVSGSRSKNFGEFSVELEATEPNRLRRVVQQAIGQQLPKRQFKVLKAAEESERAIIGRLVRIATSGATGIGGEDAS